MIFDVRSEFPQLQIKVRGKRLVYLDSAATALKPNCVIETVRESMAAGAANVHRGAHFFSDQATEKFEGVRERLRKFVGAELRDEIIFTRGTTESINLVAQTLGKTKLSEGDEILVSQMEHHSNLVPWYMIAKERGAKLVYTKITDRGEIDREDFKRKLNPRVKIVSLVHLSNSLGTLNPVEELFAAARAQGSFTVLDAAQSAAVYPLDVAKLNCDFLALSGHKMFGPTGVGILYGRKEILETLPPYQGGGSMIAEVREDEITYLPPPHRFEAGTPAIAEVIGLGAAVDFIVGLGHDAIQAHEKKIMSFAQQGLASIEGVRRIGEASVQSHALSFLLGKNHPGDVGAILDEQGIAVRAGHHCCQPMVRRFGIPGTVRASFSVYTSEEDVNDFINAVRKAKELLS